MMINLIKIMGWILILVNCRVNAAMNYHRELEIHSLPHKNQMEVFKNDQKTYDHLIAIAKENRMSFSKRWKSIIAAVELRKEKSIDDLFLLSFSNEWFVKNAVLVSLKEIKHPKKIEIVKRLLKDDSLVVRSAAVDQILNDGLDEHRDLLWEELFQERNKKKNQSLWIRKQIIAALSQNPRLIEKSLFLKLLNENEKGIVEGSLKGAQKLVLNDQEIRSFKNQSVNERIQFVKSKF